MTHSDLAALRGEPSYVWRSGTERRLQMVVRWAPLDNARVLDHGGGNGMYASQIRRRFTPHVAVFDIEAGRAKEAQVEIPHAVLAAAENLPYPSNYFDTILSNEVLEHVTDDRAAAREIVRVLKPRGRIVIFAPNRWYPFETHGHYWRGEYHFGNTPLINYLPDSLRNRLAPHVRAYTGRGIRRLFAGSPVQVVHHSRIYSGGDTLIRRFGVAGRLIRDTLQTIERTPLNWLGLSHLLVLEKID